MNATMKEVSLKKARSCMPMEINNCKVKGGLRHFTLF